MGESAERDARIAKRLAEIAPIVMFTVINDGTITWVSEPVERLFGLTRDEVVGTNMFDYVDMTWNADAIDSAVYALGARGLQRPMLFRLIRSDGTRMITEITANAQPDDPNITGLAVYARPWDERWCFDQVLDAMAEDAPLTEVLDLVLAVIGTENLDGEGVLIYHDPTTDTFQTRANWQLGVTQREAPDILGTPWQRALSEGEPCSVPIGDLPESLADEARARGHQWCWAWPVPALDEPGPVGCMVLWRRLDEPPDHTCRMTLQRLARFMSLLLRREVMNQELRHAATHDPLTELGNRAAFFAGLAKASAYSAGGAAVGRRIGVVSIDLDGFKPVNDRLGHAAGDDVLRAVAERLRSCVRGGDVVARLGGDEFSILCREVNDASEVDRLAERIVAALVEPITTRAGVVKISASVGTAVCAPGSVSDDDLLEAADRAMYLAKADGSGTWRSGDVQRVS